MILSGRCAVGGGIFATNSPKKESWQAQGRNQKPIWISYEFIQ